MRVLKRLLAEIICRSLFALYPPIYLIGWAAASPFQFMRGWHEEHLRELRELFSKDELRGWWKALIAKGWMYETV